MRFYPDYPKSVRLPGFAAHGGGKGKVKEWRDYVHAGNLENKIHFLSIVWYSEQSPFWKLVLGRVLIEFDVNPLAAEVIFEGVYKRSKIAVMMIEGEKHRQPALVNSVLFCCRLSNGESPLSMLFNSNVLLSWVCLQATDIGGRDRFGLKVYDYSIERSCGSKYTFRVPKEMYKTFEAKRCATEKMYLNYSHNKHPSMGNDRLRERTGTPHGCWWFCICLNW